MTVLLQWPLIQSMINYYKLSKMQQTLESRQVYDAVQCLLPAFLAFLKSVGDIFWVVENSTRHLFSIFLKFVCHLFGNFKISIEV